VAIIDLSLSNVTLFEISSKKTQFLGAGLCLMSAKVSLNVSPMGLVEGRLLRRDAERWRDREK
jgi:hypothetical protein